MHEMTVAQGIAETVRRERARRGLGRVRQVRARVGRMSGVLADALSACWELLTQDSDLAGAELDIQVVEPSLRCQACSTEAAFDLSADRCPHCGSSRLAVDKGMDLVVESLEVDEPGGAL